MTQQSIQTLPLDQLHGSRINVRRTGTISFEDLTASIAAHGLIQNLVVTKGEAIGNGGRGGYLVVAGGRRLCALRELAKRGTLPSGLQEGIPCLVVDRNNASEVSLVENVLREDMHPADEFDAFHNLANDGAGMSVGEIASRFGVTELYVKQRLKLANVAEELLALYREDKATLEQMMALALSDDRAAQMRVWKAAKHSWQRQPDQLRKALTESEFSTESQLGKFVGIEAYTKAGGTVRRDLFPDEDCPDAYFTDTELVQRIAGEKLQRTVEKIKKEGWLWVEARIEFDYSDERMFGRAESTWKGSKQSWSDEVKATAGAVVTIGYNGQTEIKRGFVRPEDRKAAAKASGTAVEGGRAPKAARKPGDLSFAAVQRLQAEASNIVSASLVENPTVALALLAAELADRVFFAPAGHSHTGLRTWVHIRREASGRMPGNIAQISGRAPAAARLEEQEQAWRSQLPTKRAELREWLLQQSQEFIARLLAFLIAREIDVVDVSPSAKQGVVDLAAATQVDLGAHWSPTEEWLSTLPKQTILAMAKDAGADAMTLARLAKSPKVKLPGDAIAVFPASWLPKALRARKAKAKAAP